MDVVKHASIRQHNDEESHEVQAYREANRGANKKKMQITKHWPDDSLTVYRGPWSSDPFGNPITNLPPLETVTTGTEKITFQI